MNVLSWFLSSWPHMGIKEPVDLESWQNWFGKIAIIIGVVFFPFGMIASFPVLLADEEYNVIIIVCVVWLILVSRLFSKANSYKANAYLILILLYAMLISSLIELGPTHARPAWLVTCAVMGALMFGKRGAITCVVLNIIVLFLVYWLMGPEDTAWAAEYSASYNKWIMFIVAVSLITLACSLPVGFMLHRLDRSLKHERDAKKRLFEESDKLKSANLALEKEIEQRRQAQQKLRDNEEYLELIFDYAPDGYCLTDQEGRFLNGNKACECITGYKKEELIGKTFLEAQILSSDQHPEAMSIFEKFRQGLPYGPEELILTRKNGGKVTVEINTYPIKIKNMIQMLGIARDISGRKQAEKEKKILEAQLSQAQKMEAIGTLAGGIAHDFNNILAALIGFTELALRDAPKETPMERNLRGVLKAGGRAKELVKQILTFSRYTEQELKPIQVKIIAKEVLKLIRASLPSTIEIRQNIASESAIMADPVQVHQVLMNFCTNAGHAMMDNGGVLDVSLTDVELDAEFLERHMEMNPGTHIKLTVKDTGQGMSPEVIDRIFDPYFTTKAHGEGTGLGLSVVHGIIKSYEGAIDVRSEPGKGSIFDVYLPVIGTERGLADESEEPLVTGNGHILFIDDEPVLIDVGMQMLEKLGYKVSARTSSVEALELFRAQPERFDIIITDMTMPVMTGEALAGEIMKVRPDIPIILCTGFSPQINKQKAAQLGIKSFIMKPFVLKEIGIAVHEAMGKA